MTKRSRIVVRLRERIWRAINAGALSALDRLPSTRVLALEFRADPRVIAAAYRELELEALVDVREKSGVYVSPTAVNGEKRGSLPPNWVAKAFTDVVIQGIPLSELATMIFDFSDTRRILVAVVAETSDQVTGIVRELKRDYGLNATGHHLGEIRTARASSKFSAAQVIVASGSCVSEVQSLASGRRVIAVHTRDDLFANAGCLAFGECEVYLVARDPAFAQKVRQAVQRANSPTKLRVLIAGRDDLSRIPMGALTYVTESARLVIGKTQLPGRVIRPVRLFSEETVSQIIHFLVAFHSRGDWPSAVDRSIGHFPGGEQSTDRRAAMS